MEDPNLIEVGGAVETRRRRIRYAARGEDAGGDPSGGIQTLGRFGQRVEPGQVHASVKVERERLPFAEPDDPRHRERLVQKQAVERCHANAVSTEAQRSRHTCCEGGPTGGIHVAVGDRNGARHVGTANQVVGFSQPLHQLPRRLLPRADHHVVDRQHLLLTVNTDMQTGIIDFQVLAAGQHVHALLAQPEAMDPARGLAQARAHTRGLALQQIHLARRGGDLSGNTLDTTAG